MPSAARQLHRRTAPRDRDEGGKMAWIVEHIEISRRPEDVFSYAIDFARFPEWQEGIVSVRREGNTPLAVGSKAVVTRRVGPRQLPGTEEITELSFPRTWMVRAVGGPVTAVAKDAVARDYRPRVRGARDRQAAGSASHASPGTKAAAEERAEAERGTRA